MENLQQQLAAINSQLEAMHQKIENLSIQVGDLIASLPPGAGHSSGTALSEPRQAPQTTVSAIHRDILVEEDHMALNEARGKSLSHELQMQRLMAQLTAAYNRIAALEEQLLSRRLLH